MRYLLWFDVEERYNTTVPSPMQRLCVLWFDVEERYNTTNCKILIAVLLLWFDVEERYNTTIKDYYADENCCGLM